MSSPAPTAPTFLHEALFYERVEHLVEEASRFVEEGLELGEPVLVLLPRPGLDHLREALGERAQDADLRDIEPLGRNPGRIVGEWERFVAAHRGGSAPARGIGEPLWAGRTRAETEECHQQEALLNLAFADAPGLHLLCPYDTRRLERSDVARAEATHPLLRRGGTVTPSASYVPPSGAPPAAPLAPPPAGVHVHAIQPATLADLRAFTARHATEHGLTPARASGLVLAISELAANSLHHGGGHGTLRTWVEDGAVVHEVRDGGRITDPLVGRRRPSIDERGGRGLWLVHQLCDLVEIRSSDQGTVVRIRVALP